MQHSILRPDIHFAAPMLFCGHCCHEWEMSEYGELRIPTSSLYSVHIEYNYKKLHRDCIDLSTLNDAFFIYPKGSNFSVTKVSLATEELFKNCWSK